MTVTRLVLVRHGQTTWNVEDRLTSRTDAPLTDFGRDQARGLGVALAKNTSFDAAVSSPRTRARETAALILEQTSHGLTATVDERLVEVDCGPFEGLTERELHHGPMADAARAWRAGAVIPDGCEPDEVAADRALAFLDSMRSHRGETVLVVSHGHLLRVMLATAVLGLPARGNVHRLKIHNCRAAVIELRPGSARLTALNALEI